MKIDLLVAEIGSTTTIVNAFSGLMGEDPQWLGQGQAATSVEAGDVSIGLEAAIEELRKKLGASELSWEEMLASSSAAGGLKMTVHGLVYDMTVRAAREACLGSGAVIHHVSAGKLRRGDLKRITEVAPKLIYLAGGTDYGEYETALYNAEVLMDHFPDIPLIYAGNISNVEEIKEMAEEKDVKIYLTENVYPALDQLNIEPSRQLIHQAFEENIVHSSGMEKIRDLVNGPILPTPGAVMEAAILLQKELGDLLVMDIGGATTDLHSVTAGDPAKEDLLVQAEPFAKRSVEGDLGVYVNRKQLFKQFTEEEQKHLGSLAERFLLQGGEIPSSEEEILFVQVLAQRAAERAFERHAGQWREHFTGEGMKRLIEGKDLTAVRHVIGTGGALTRLPLGKVILERALAKAPPKALYPAKEVAIHLDNDYLMASLGVLAKTYPKAALKLLKKSLRWE